MTVPATWAQADLDTGFQFRRTSTVGLAGNFGEVRFWSHADLFLPGCEPLRCLSVTPALALAALGGNLGF